LLGTVSTGFAFLMCIAVLVLGLVVVRPLNKVAGLIFAGAGAARIVGLGLDVLFDLLRPKDAQMETFMLFSAIGTLLWLITATAFYGGVMFGAVKLADTHTNSQTQRGAW
jgi:hypothetical protein